MAEPTICSYYGCDKPILESEAIHDGHSMNFCAEHDAEFTKIAQADPFDPAALIRFWVKANGGAQRMADAMFGEA